MSTTQIERLRALVEPLASERGLDLEELGVSPAGKRRVLRVVVDSDEGVQLDTCAELSRDVSAALDEDDVMGGQPYTLEVTSPGADRPLSEPRHYRRAVGRLVAFHLHEGGELTARITAVDDEGLDVEVPGVKGRKPTARRIAFDGVARARVEIEFNRKAPADADDAAADPENAESGKNIKNVRNVRNVRNTENEEEA
ncbi:ribosome maturation factor RimP [Streptomyces sp. 549]|uniref:ribosome maturation factor RimP n=1 Tax=Streptomyces sp. 549 TaxID=3049076 RepID=UPI0024C3CF1D|nr:ribosome maturation factor RimP [Streptomyces sp. 549]MDK1475157.1 ribosome maturation factor RimP [Streptomyces sp. 549]